MLLLRWSRLLHNGIRPHSSSKPRPLGCRSPTDRSTQPSGTLSSSTSASPTERRSSSGRVLVSGGRLALSTWDAPERSPFFATILGAVADANVPPPTAIPTGPSFFQFADDVVFEALLQDAGFADVHIDAISFGVPLGSAEELVAGLVEGTVRTGALLRAADDEVLSSASRWRRGWSRGDARRRMRSRRRSRLQADASRHERVYERQPKRGCAETRGRTSLSLQSDRVPVAGGNQ